jgi:hypothetical protein
MIQKITADASESIAKVYTPKEADDKIFLLNLFLRQQ